MKKLLFATLAAALLLAPLTTVEASYEDWTESLVERIAGLVFLDLRDAGALDGSGPTPTVNILRGPELLPDGQPTVAQSHTAAPSVPELGSPP